MSLVFGRGVRDSPWMVEEGTEEIVCVKDSKAKVMDKKKMAREM